VKVFATKTAGDLLYGATTSFYLTVFQAELVNNAESVRLIPAQGCALATLGTRIHFSEYATLKELGRGFVTARLFATPSELLKNLLLPL
jgi:hypothetical protein